MEYAHVDRFNMNTYLWVPKLDVLVKATYTHYFLKGPLLLKVIDMYESKKHRVSAVSKWMLFLYLNTYQPNILTQITSCHPVHILRSNGPESIAVYTPYV